MFLLKFFSEILQF